MASRWSVSWKDGAYFCFLSAVYSTGAAGKRRGRKDTSLMLEIRDAQRGLLQDLRLALRDGLGADQQRGRGLPWTALP